MLSKQSAECFAIGLLVGTVIGAAIGIMYAPNSGIVTRARIRLYRFFRRYEHNHLY